MKTSKRVRRRKLDTAKTDLEPPLCSTPEGRVSDEGRNKSKTAKKSTQSAEPVKKEEQKAAESPTAPGLFDMSAPVSGRYTPSTDSDEEAEILAEIKQETEEEDEALVTS